MRSIVGGLIGRAVCWYRVKERRAGRGRILAVVNGLLKRNFIAFIILPLRFFWLFVKVLLQ